MFGTAVTQTSAWLSPRQILTLLLPTAGFAATVLWLIDRTIDAYHWWVDADAATKTFIGVGAAVALVILVLVEQQLLVSLTRWYCGYWGSGPFGRRVAAAGRRRHQRMLKNLEAQASREDPVGNAYRRLFLYYPPEDQVMPTRLGNVFKAVEAYVASPFRYNMNAAFFWPRLFPLLPESLRVELAAARAVIDMTLVSGTLSAALAGLVAVFAGPAHLAWWVTLVLLAGLLGLSRLSYLWAVLAAVDHGELVRTAFDVGRRGLLVSLGLKLPGSLEDEQRLWEALGSVLYLGGTSSELENTLRFTTD